MTKISTCDAVKAYSDGRRDGEKAVLRMLHMILVDGQHNKSITYYKASIELVLEIFGYGKEEKEN